MNLFGKELIHLSHIDSTNNFAATLLSEQDCQSGMAIMADSQTLGRGQRGNVWLSEKDKNLLVSFIFKPDNLSVTQQIQLTWATSLALVETLAKFNIVSQIKWPNDIMVHGKKIAGILIENQLLGERISSSIIGIGLNVNQHDFGGYLATSLCNELGNSLKIEVVFDALCSSMNKYFNNIVSFENQFLKQQYEHTLFQKNEFNTYEDEEGQFQGKILGISNQGTLLIEVNDEQKEYGIKEIRYCSK